MAGTISTLRVTTETLLTTASELESTGSSIGTLTQEMLSLVDNLHGIWTGDAASAYLNTFHALDDDIGRMVAMINEHVSDLETMAQNYQEVEEENIDLLSSVAVQDVITQVA